MMLRRWESWAVYTRAGAKVGERFLRRHFTARGAFRWAESVTSDPKVLASTLGSVMNPNANGHLTFVDPDVRPAGSTPKGERGRTGRAGEFGATGRR